MEPLLWTYLPKVGKQH